MFITNTYEGTLVEHGIEGEVFWVEKDTLITPDLASGFEKIVEVMTNPSLNEFRIYKNHEETDWTHILQ